MLLPWGAPTIAQSLKNSFKTHRYFLIQLDLKNIMKHEEKEMNWLLSLHIL